MPHQEPHLITPLPMPEELLNHIPFPLSNNDRGRLVWFKWQCWNFVRFQLGYI